MALDAEEIQEVLDFVVMNEDFIDHNAILFDIHEGNLAPYVLQDLKNQLSPDAFKQIQARLAPINVLRKIIDKLSSVYTNPPRRQVIDGNETDKELLAFYEEKMSFNCQLGLANKMFNLHKVVALDPFIKDGTPRLRVLPGDRMMAASLEDIDKTEMTHFIKFMGQKSVFDEISGETHVKELFLILTNDEIVVVDEKGDPDFEEMLKMNNPEGINPFGVIPQTYINKSEFSIVPIIDTDTLTMTKLIPVLVSDLNYGVMFQAFSIIFGIDVKFKNLEKNPNAFWDLKSSGDGKPEIGTIKPEIDILEMLQLIQTELAMWMQSRNVKAGTMGKLTMENLASGLSKIIDEADTTKDVKDQIAIFKKAENEFWNEKLIPKLHPTWVKDGRIEEKRLFSAKARIVTDFLDPKPHVDRIQLIDEQEKEVTAQFTTQKRAIQKLNPELTPTEVDKLIEEIKLENTVEVSIPGEGETAQTNIGEHTHLINGLATGPLVKDPKGGHYHSIPGKEDRKTSSTENTPGHIHTFEGQKTGPPVG